MTTFDTAAASPEAFAIAPTRPLPSKSAVVMPCSGAKCSGR